jgi:hypothetical protein
MTPEQRQLRASIAAHTMHSMYDAVETSAKGRAAFLARFEREVDPDGKLDPATRSRRAEHLLAAHMKRLALKSSKARRLKADQARGPAA